MPQYVDEFAASTNGFLAEYARFITEEFGPRCPDYEPECACCHEWAVFDVFSKKMATTVEEAQR